MRDALDKAIKMLDAARKRTTVRFMNEGDAIDFCSKIGASRSEIDIKVENGRNVFYVDCIEVKYIMQTIKADIYKYYGKEKSFIENGYKETIIGESKDEIKKTFKKNIRNKFGSNAGPERETVIKEKEILEYIK